MQKFNSFEDLRRAMYGETEVKEENKVSVREKIASYNITVPDEPEETRNDDDKAERRFTSFLGENVYPLLVKAGITDEIIDVNEKSKQCKGSDATYYTKNGKIEVDNKNRASVINRKARAPFEIYTDNKYGNRMLGWFVDPDKHTDYILSTHCFTKDTSQRHFKNIEMDDISKINMYFIKLDDVRHYLETNGVSFKELPSEAVKFENDFRKRTAFLNKEDITSAMRQKTIAPGVIMYTSIGALKEDPTVLLLDDSLIEQLPNTRHFEWNRNWGLKEIYDKAIRPDLTPSEENAKKAKALVNDIAI